jgi:type II secretory pathway predicted ATPase ExeA
VEWSHFGLDRQPFRPAVDPDSYFPAASHEAALAAVASGFARRDPAVLIDGPPGVGKTLVARKWLEHLLPDVPRVVVPNARAERPADLLQAILFDLGKPYHGLGEQELRLAVTGHLLDVATGGSYPTVLLLDEAQHLAQPVLEELRLLGNLETRRGTALFAVLVAQPALREAFRQPEYEPFAQRVAARAAVEPLTPAESADYLRHQLRAAGGEAEKILADDAAALLTGACGGVPRVLNRAASLALELACAAGAEQADVEAAVEALDRLGLTPAEPDEPTDPVLLPHPARAAEPARPRRGKAADVPAADEAATGGRSKDRASRKRSA